MNCDQRECNWELKKTGTRQKDLLILWWRNNIFQVKWARLFAIVSFVRWLAFSCLPVEYAKRYCARVYVRTCIINWWNSTISPSSIVSHVLGISSLSLSSIHIHNIPLLGLPRYSVWSWLLGGWLTDCLSSSPSQYQRAFSPILL